MGKAEIALGSLAMRASRFGDRMVDMKGLRKVRGTQ